jgi:baseplate J-like protein
MAELNTVHGRPTIDYMARDYDSILQSMRTLIPEKLPEWTDFESPADFGNVLLQLFAHMGDVLSYYQDRVANESFLGTARQRSSVIQHLQLIGYRLSTAAPASAVLTLSVPAACTDVITIQQGDAFATKSQKNKPSTRFEYTPAQALVINCATLPIDSATNRKVFTGIPVEEGRLVRDEILGTSDGTPNQRFALAHSGLILRSLGEGQAISKDIVLVTQLGGTPQEWTRQESLAFSREGQTDFVLEIADDDRATVLFGDGAFGAVPPSGATIKATYRVGGGPQGNVAPQTIQTIVDAPQLVLLGAKIGNPKPATGGAERESIEHAVLHAPSVFRSLKRAVTGADYEALALDFKGVGKVRATATDWNIVTLAVAPAGGGQISDVLVANLLAYFEDKRPIATVIEVEDVEYVQIFVTAEVGIKNFYNAADVQEQVVQAVGRLLAFENVDFGQTLYLSKFYEATEAIEGVEFVNIIEFRREDETTNTVAASGKIELRDHEVPAIPTDNQAYAGGIRVVAAEGD